MRLRQLFISCPARGTIPPFKAASASIRCNPTFKKEEEPFYFLLLFPSPI
jgi:hypothetical protein